MGKRKRHKRGQDEKDKRTLVEIEAEQEKEARIHDANIEMYGVEDAFYHTFIKD